MAKPGLQFTTRVYDRIRKGLESGEWLGGHELSETVLARELKVSRTPVREAIRRLESEGFISSLPKRGTLVRRPTRQDILELFQLREALEAFAAAEAARIITDEELGEMERLLGQMVAARKSAMASSPDELVAIVQTYWTLDAALHMVLLRSIGNRRILKVVADCRIMTQLMGYPKESLQVFVANWERTNAEHAEMVRVLREHDPEKARAWMAKHLQEARERSLAFYDQLGQREAMDAMPAPEWPEHVREVIRKLEEQPPK